MGILDTIRVALGGNERDNDRVLGWFGDDEEEGGYRCIRCGEEHDRNYHTCPSCGAQFVAPVDQE